MSGGLHELYHCDNGRRLHLTAEQLVKANTESIALGFSRNLTQEALEVLDRDGQDQVPIHRAYRHTASADPSQHNVRLMMFFPAPNTEDGCERIVRTDNKPNGQWEMK